MKLLLFFFIGVLGFFSFQGEAGNNTERFAGGSGTSQDPYLVQTSQHLYHVRYYPDRYFKQIEHIDLKDYQEGKGWLPVGEDYNNRFSGTYDGDNYTISNLAIEKKDSQNVGLFGMVEGAVLKNITLKDIEVSGGQRVGGLAGYSKQSEISHCEVTGKISGVEDVGLLAGENYHGVIENCSVEGIVEGRLSSALLAGNSDATKITGCTGTGEVSGDLFVGGIVGRWKRGNIKNSFYNYEETTINEETGFITIGALSAAMYEDWVSNNRQLYAHDYFDREGDWYLIKEEEDFQSLLAFGYQESAKFLLEADLDLAEMVNFYIPYFAGTFDGNNHIISGLRLTRNKQDRAGLFGLSENARISNLSLRNFRVSGYQFVGGVVGEKRQGSMENVSARGGLDGKGGYATYNGGLIGYNDGGIITKSYSTGMISGTADYIGGVAGYNAGVIQRSFSGAIVESLSLSSFTGGLSGWNETTVRDSFTTGKVKGQKGAIGRLTGLNNGEITGCFSTTLLFISGETEGLAGENWGAIDASYYLWEEDGSLPGDESARTYDEMRTKSTFQNWDFEERWNIVEGKTFPYLQWKMTDNPYDSLVEKYSLPSYLILGENDELFLEIRNTGNQKWEKDEEIFLEAVGGHDGITDSALWRTGLQYTVEPGMKHSFVFDIEGKEPGFWETEWRMIRNGDFWFGDNFRKTVEVICPAEYKAEIISSDIPTTMQKGEYYQVSLKVRNAGEAVWRAGEVYLGARGDYHKLVPPDFWRIRLSRDIKPGETYSFKIEYYSEEPQEDLATKWQLLREGIFWFDEFFESKVSVIEPTRVKGSVWRLY